MNTIISAVYDDDYNTVTVSFAQDSTIIIYCGWIEDYLETTIASRAELDWLIDNEPATYSELVLSGDMQDYLNGCQRDYVEQRKTVTDEFMMYSRST
jgi:sarcosine oxidase delta subunit